MEWKITAVTYNDDYDDPYFFAHIPYIADSKSNPPDNNDDVEYQQCAEVIKDAVNWFKPTSSSANNNKRKRGAASSPRSSNNNSSSSSSSK